MDNFEDLIFIIFIVISLLGSLLKSNKDRKQVPANKDSKPAPEKKPKKTDILSEVDAWFKNQFPEDLIKSSPQKQTEFINPRQYTIPEKIEIKTEPVKLKIPSIKTSVNKKAAYINSKLSNKNSLKEYIIFNEILGKPKALRDY